MAFACCVYYIRSVCTRAAPKKTLTVTVTVTLTLTLSHRITAVGYWVSGNVVRVRILICGTRQTPCRKRVYCEWRIVTSLRHVRLSVWLSVSLKRTLDLCQTAKQFKHTCQGGATWLVSTDWCLHGLTGWPSDRPRCVAGAVKSARQRQLFSGSLFRPILYVRHRMRQYQMHHCVTTKLCGTRRTIAAMDG